jgi:hypothetical protein
MRAQPARQRLVPAHSGGASAAEKWPDDSAAQPDAAPTSADGEPSDGETGPVRAGRMAEERPDDASRSDDEAGDGNEPGEAGEGAERDLSVPIMVGFAIASVLVVLWAAGGLGTG